MSLKQLEEKQQELRGEIARLQKLDSEEGRTWSGEDQANWEKVNKEYDELTVKISRARRVDEVSKIERDTDTPGREDRKGESGTGEKTVEVTEETRTLAFNAWARVQSGLDPTDRQLEACKQVRFNPRSSEIEIPVLSGQDRADLQRRFQNTHPSKHHEIQLEARANMSNVIGASGQYLDAPSQLIRNLEVNMLAFGGMEQVAEIINTSTGDRLTLPTADDTSNAGVQLGENTSIGSSVAPSFAQVILDAYKFSSQLVLVPAELLQDSMFDIAGMLGSMLGERLGRISNTKFTTGTGAGTPKGITNCSTLGVTSTTATVITADEVLGLVHSVDPAYRNGARFMFHDGILLYLRKLKDGEGRYLWQQGVGAAPDTLWGFPYTINQDMQSTVATGTKTILFGQLNKYKIRRAGGIRMRRLVERYADYDQEGFVAFIRQDGNLLQAGTAPVKHLLQA